MAKLENIQMALHAVLNLHNLRRDIVGNMADEANAAANLSEYKRRLDWHDDDELIEALDEGLAALGVDLKDYEAQIADISATVGELEKPEAGRDAVKLALEAPKEFFKAPGAEFQKRERTRRR